MRHFYILKITRFRRSQDYPIENQGKIKLPFHLLCKCVGNDPAPPSARKLMSYKDKSGICQEPEHYKDISKHAIVTSKPSDSRTVHALMR